MKKIRKMALLNQEEDQIVKDRAKLDGETWNAALRAIIREWARTAPTNGKTITIGGEQPAGNIKLPQAWKSEQS